MPEIVDSFASSLELFLNTLEFIALIASCVTFFFLMFNQYAKALKYILAPCGLGFWGRLRILFLCRKSPVMKRAFLEFAMLKTQGRGKVAGEWRSIINEFRAFYATVQGELVYTIPNCTLLIGEDFSDVARRYFTFFQKEKPRKAFGIHDSQLSWVMKIRIEEAYATPTCLLTGLLSAYEENWSEFIKRYVSTAFIAENDENIGNDILTNELYLTFVWLLWGPSFELDYTSCWAGLCQISYGDESNSIPAVANLNTGVSEQLAARFAGNRGRRYGALVSAEFTILENKRFYQSIRDAVNPEDAYFYDKIEDSPLSFAARMDSFTPYQSYKSQKYYCTAYVWLLFGLEEEGEYSFHPEKSVAFFEHANLTDQQTYHFLIETLIDKSIKHFTAVFRDARYTERRYRFICAMNEEIAGIFCRRYRELMEEDSQRGRMFRERILLKPKYTPAQAFAAYDEFFAPSRGMEFLEVRLDQKDTISDLARFYTEVYMECFPDKDERESFDNLLLYLQNGQAAEEYCYHILLARDERGEIVGGGIFDYFRRTNTAVIEFIAVKSDLQSGGMGSLIYQHIRSVLADDAYRNCRKPVSCIFCEIDSPEHSKASIKKYLYFWNKHHYRRLDFRYIQPALSAKQEPVTGLWFTVSIQHEKQESIEAGLVVQVIRDYMRFAMQVEQPDQEPAFRQMRQELEEKGQVALQKII